MAMTCTNDLEFLSLTGLHNSCTVKWNHRLPPEGIIITRLTNVLHLFSYSGRTLKPRYWKKGFTLSLVNGYRERTRNDYRERTEKLKPEKLGPDWPAPKLQRLRESRPVQVRYPLYSYSINSELIYTPIDYFLLIANVPLVNLVSKRWRK